MEYLKQMKRSLEKVYGCQLKKIRLMRDIHRTKVAKAVNVTFQQIQKYEKGVNACPKWNELKLCELFDDGDFFVKPLMKIIINF